MLKDKIIKASWNHFEGAKDIIINNINYAIRNGIIKIDQNTAEQLLKIAASSVEEGYHKGYGVFDREVSSLLDTGSKETHKLSNNKSVVQSKKN